MKPRFKPKWLRNGNYSFNNTTHARELTWFVRRDANRISRRSLEKRKLDVRNKSLGGKWRLQLKESWSGSCYWGKKSHRNKRQLLNLTKLSRRIPEAWRRQHRRLKGILYKHTSILLFQKCKLPTRKNSKFNIRFLSSPFYSSLNIYEAPVITIQP